MADMYGDPELLPDMNMVVVSNSHRSNGASAISDHQTLDAAREMTGSEKVYVTGNNASCGFIS